MVVTVMVVPGRGKRRGGNNHSEQGGEQEFPHGSNPSIGACAKTATFAIGIKKSKGAAIRNQGTGIKH